MWPKDCTGSICMRQFPSLKKVWCLDKGIYLIYFPRLDYSEFIRQRSIFFHKWVYSSHALAHHINLLHCLYAAYHKPSHTLSQLLLTSLCQIESVGPQICKSYLHSYNWVARWKRPRSPSHFLEDSWLRQLSNPPWTIFWARNHFNWLKNTWVWGLFVRAVSLVQVVHIQPSFLSVVFPFTIESFVHWTSVSL